MGSPIRRLVAQTTSFKRPHSEGHLVIDVYRIGLMDKIAPHGEVMVTDMVIAKIITRKQKYILGEQVAKILQNRGYKPSCKNNLGGVI